MLENMIIMFCQVHSDSKEKWACTKFTQMYFAYFTDLYELH